MIGAMLHEAWRAMGANRLRTLLTMLGMVIGVGAVVLMLAVGDGARHTVNEQIRAMGSNLFIITSGASTSSGVRMGSGTKPTITRADADALAKLPTLDGVAPVQSQTAQLAYGASNWSAQVYGVTPEFMRVRDWAIESGQGISDTDVRSAARVVVLGQVVKKELFGVEDPLGKTVRIKNLPFTVVGVAAAKGHEPQRSRPGRRRLRPAHAGVRLGDVIVAAGGVKVNALADFYRLVWSQGEAGARIPLLLGRGGAPVEVVVRSGNREDFLRRPSLQ